MYIQLKQAPEVLRVIRAVASDGSFHQNEAEILPFSGPMSVASNWSGGTRYFYGLVNLSNMSALTVGESGGLNQPQAGELEALPEGFALVQTCILQGSPRRARVYVNPVNLNQFRLPEASNTNPWELVVLYATRSRKSSYPPYGSDYRFMEARRATKITREEWDAAKAACIAKGLLNKAGAITASGRNAVSQYVTIDWPPAPMAS